MVLYRRKRIRWFAGGTVVLQTVLLLVFTGLGLTDGAQEAVSFWVVGAGSAMVLSVLGSAVSRTQCAVLYAGYLVRCVCMLTDIYGRSYVRILHSGGDSEAFARYASALYQGTMEGTVSTKYPYMISSIYRVLGENRLCVQYVNVIFWVLGACMLIRICGRFHTAQNSRCIIYAIWTLLPNGIFLSGILLRESAEVFFGMWSFERFLLWMQRGRWRYCVQAFVCVIPAMVLHSASAALWAAYAAVMMFWDIRRKKYRWQFKTCLVFLMGVAALALLRGTSAYGLLFGKLGGDFSLYGITHRVFRPGGSDYLTGIDCQSLAQFVPDTLVCMFYFLFSPLPLEARGMKDIAMFLADSLPLAAVIVWTFVSGWKKRDIRGYAYAALLGGFSFAGIFAWGVRNAGTAVRHRYLAWSIFIIALCVCCGSMKEEREGRACRTGN